MYFSIRRLLLVFHMNELENLDKQLWLDEVFINCRDNEYFYALPPLRRRYERESVAVEAVCVISLNYGH